MGDFFDELCDSIEVNSEYTPSDFFETDSAFCISNMGARYRTGSLCNDETYRKYIENRINTVIYRNSELKFRVIIDDDEYDDMYDRMKLTVKISGKFSSVCDIISFITAIDIRPIRYSGILNKEKSEEFYYKYKRSIWFFSYKEGKIQNHTVITLPEFEPSRMDLITSTFMKTVCELSSDRKIYLPEIYYNSFMFWKKKTLVSEYRQLALWQQETLMHKLEKINSSLDDNDDAFKSFIINPQIQKDNMVKLICGEYCEDGLTISVAIKSLMHRNHLIDDYCISGFDKIGYYKTHTIYNEQTWKNRNNKSQEENECFDIGVYSDIMNIILENAHMFRNKRKMVLSYGSKERKNISDANYIYRYCTDDKGNLYISTILREIFIEKTNQILVVSLALYGNKQKVENLILKLLTKS